MMLFRRILFYCFLLIYLTGCPLLIFYTLGYRFDIEGDQGLVKTGAFSITTIPEGAIVRLGHRKVTQKTPAVILNLRMGQYDVLVEKEGFQPWVNQINIEAERAVVAEKIILLPKELSSKVVAQGPLKKIAIFKEGTLALAVRGDRLSDLFVLDMIKNTEYVLANADSHVFQQGEVKAIYTMPLSQVFWLWLDDSAEGRMLRVRVRFGTLEVEDWSRYFRVKPDELQWDVNAEDKVYALHDQTLTVIDLERGTVGLAGRELHGFRVCKQRVFMSQNQGVFRTDSDGLHPRSLLDDPTLAASLFEGREHLDIGVYAGGTLLFLDPNGVLFSNRLPYWISRKHIRGYVYDELKSQAAIWTDKKIGILDFSRDSFLREEAFERKIRKRWIYREGHSISQVQWAVDGTYLIFQDQKKVYLIETLNGLSLQPRFLVEADPRYPIFFSEGQGLLYYVDPETQSWMALRLIPKRELLGEAFAKSGSADERDEVEPTERVS